MEKRRERTTREKGQPKRPSELAETPQGRARLTRHRKETRELAEPPEASMEGLLKEVPE